MNAEAALKNFRSALRALLPMMERADVPWRRPDAYDEWDSVATALFKSLVEGPLCWSLAEEAQSDFKLAEYDLLSDDYAKVSTLEIKHSSLGLGRWVFNALSTVAEPFDSIEVVQLSTEGTRVSKQLAVVSIEEASISLRLSGGPEAR